MSDDREKAAARLGVPSCSRCGTLGAHRTQVTNTGVFNSPPLRCCSIACACALLEGLVSGSIYSTQKDSYLIGRKVQGGRQGLEEFYFSKRGREALEAEKRRAARLASRAG